MKKKLLWLMLLSAIFCTLFAMGSAHAATRQSHASELSPSLSRVGCAYTSGLVDIYTDYTPSGFDLVCFSGTGEQYVNLYNVAYLYTGYYTVYWTWVDCNGATHYSVKGPDTWVDASTSPGKFAGYDVMCDIVYIALS